MIVAPTEDDIFTPARRTIRSGLARNSRKLFFAPIEAHYPHIRITEHATHDSSRAKARERIDGLTIRIASR